ncbi:hypothetical protein GBA52_011814 [Prunus armeniaca]|nr:hypothetical protein GBA52_011814 [Prunus armeniaca]
MAGFSLLLIFLIITCFLTATFVSSSQLHDPELVAQEVHRSINASRRNLGYLSCGTGNPIDDCWRCDPNWEQNPPALSRLRHWVRQGRHRRKKTSNLPSQRLWGRRPSEPQPEP